MRRVLLAIDIQAGLNSPSIIVEKVNNLARKYPTIATTLTQGDKEADNQATVDWKAPKEDVTLVHTDYQYERHSYQLPQLILKTLEKNNVDEVLVTGAARESFLLAAGFALFDAGFNASMIAPLCLTGQYHQHTVTMKIWENSIGKVYEDIAEI